MSVLAASTKVTCCPHCHSYTLLKNGTRARQIQTLPIGSRRCYIKLTNQRYKCTSCHWDGWQKISGILKGKSYTYRFAQHVVDLLRMGTIKAVANHLGVGWDLIKSIHMEYQPKAQIVLDHFHIMKLIEETMQALLWNHEKKDGKDRRASAHGCYVR